MYKVKYVIDGIVKEMTVDAHDAVTAQNLVTNMYSNGKVQIIDIRRI